MPRSSLSSLLFFAPSGAAGRRARCLLGASVPFRRETVAGGGKRRTSCIRIRGAKSPLTPPCSLQSSLERHCQRTRITLDFRHTTDTSHPRTAER
ncbi:hypothetical protein PF005_g32449, partial [Phytophthora fragariae]